MPDFSQSNSNKARLHAKMGPDTIIPVCAGIIVSGPIFGAHFRELDALPGKIESLEHQQAELVAKMAEPGFYQADFKDIQQVTDRLAVVEKELEAVFNRWAELDGA